MNWVQWGWVNRNWMDWGRVNGNCVDRFGMNRGWLVSWRRMSNTVIFHISYIAAVASDISSVVDNLDAAIRKSHLVLASHNVGVSSGQSWRQSSRRGRHTQKRRVWVAPHSPHGLACEWARGGLAVGGWGQLVRALGLKGGQRWLQQKPKHQ